jgi:hypothetical protein
MAELLATFRFVFEFFFTVDLPGASFALPMCTSRSTAAIARSREIAASSSDAAWQMSTHSPKAQLTRSEMRQRVRNLASVACAVRLQRMRRAADWSKRSRQRARIQG